MEYRGLLEKERDNNLSQRAEEGRIHDRAVEKQGIYQITETIPCTRHCFRRWGYSSNKVSALIELIFWRKETKKHKYMLLSAMNNLKLGWGVKRVLLFYKWWSEKGLLEGCIWPDIGGDKGASQVAIGGKLLGKATMSIKVPLMKVSSMGSRTARKMPTKLKWNGDRLLGEETGALGTHYHS